MTTTLPETLDRDLSWLERTETDYRADAERLAREDALDSAEFAEHEMEQAAKRHPAAAEKFVAAWIAAHPFRAVKMFDFALLEDIVAAGQPIAVLTPTAAEEAKGVDVEF